MLRFIIVLIVVATVCGFARTNMRMGLDPVLSKAFPRDFSKIPFGTDYGAGTILSVHVYARLASW